ncbi:SMI1/KNR4 family protein [Bacillus velezensis]|uniref:SMI1/KNR4 family protein n=1 Tax=Bacillus velezensis TaxID=492670 RepID=UPI00119F89A4|nr:SMI1/KNR4 family protein [Bacillus velezensis]
MSYLDIKEKMNEFNLDIRIDESVSAQEVIRRFEENNSFIIDNDYKDFLYSYGECWIQEENVLFPVLEDNLLANNGNLRLGYFYGLNNNDANLIKLTRDLSEQMPDWIIPIADADGGDQICLGVKGDHVGRVYLWDHELTDGVKDTFLISNSFSDFIQSLFAGEIVDDEDDGILYIELDDDLLKS